MKILLRSLLTVVLVASGAAAVAGSPVTDITPAQLQALTDRGVKVIDVRRADEWRGTGVVPGSTLITTFDADGRLDPQFLTQVAKVAAVDEPVALICRTGNRSNVAAKLMAEKLGYQRLYNVAGGIHGWIEAGGAVVGCPTC